jgi:hypothetical protein
MILTYVNSESNETNLALLFTSFFIKKLYDKNFSSSRFW